MAWYDAARRLELQPESDTQPAIVPTQFILHSIAAPWTPERIYEYWRDSTNLESHFGLGFDGALAQYIGTQTRADANFHANRRPDGTGAVSLESASNLNHTDPWTPQQVDSIILLGAWLHHTHGIPVRVCRSDSDPGFGYHGLFPAWSDGGTACPGAARIQQFHDVIMPGIAAAVSGTTPEGNPMADFTEADIYRIVSDAVKSQSVRDTIAFAVDYLMDPKAEARAAAAPQRLLDTVMPDYATLPGGYHPTFGETANGSKTADEQLTALRADVAALAARIEQICGGSPA